MLLLCHIAMLVIACDAVRAVLQYTVHSQPACDDQCCTLPFLQASPDAADVTGQWLQHNPLLAKPQPAQQGILFQVAQPQLAPRLQTVRLHSTRDFSWPAGSSGPGRPQVVVHVDSVQEWPCPQPEGLYRQVGCHPVLCGGSMAGWHRPSQSDACVCKQARLGRVLAPRTAAVWAVDSCGRSPYSWTVISSSSCF